MVLELIYTATVSWLVVLRRDPDASVAVTGVDLQAGR